MKFRDYVKPKRIDEVALLAGLADLAEYGKLVAQFGPKAAKKWRAIEKALGELNDMMKKEKAKQKFVKGKLKEGMLTEERSDYSTEHLQDVIRHIRNGIEDMYELFDDIEDRKGMIQANKMKKEWKALEKMAKPFVYNMDKIHQFRDERKNGGKKTEPTVKSTEEPGKGDVEKSVEKSVEKPVTEAGLGSMYLDLQKTKKSGKVAWRDGEELKRIADKYHLVDDMRSVRTSIYEFNEFLSEIGDKLGMNQFKKFYKEWLKLEKILQQFSPKSTYKKGSFK
jgi:hypothetical protein